MSMAQLIMDPSGSDPIVVLDSGKNGIHYIDLSEAMGISLGPGKSLHIHCIGSKVSIDSVRQEDGERIVERWLSLRKVH
jgi:hypothetical protein